MNFLIWAPPYYETSGGVRVLHKLFRMLKDAGHVPDLGMWLKADPSQVHIIPDIVPADAVKSKMVVRYALAPPRLHGIGDPEWNEDLCFVWLQKYYPKATEFHLDVIDRSVFFDNHSPRVFDSVYNLGRANPPKIRGEICLKRHWPDDCETVARILRHTKTYYSFDRETLLNYEARLCGCKVMVQEKGEWVEFVDQLPPESPLSMFVDKIKSHFKL